MYELIDLKVDSEGDLTVSNTGDLDLSTPAESIQQEILFRVKTNHMEYLPATEQGASLEDLNGPVSERIGKAIQEHVHIALTIDGFLNPNYLLVDVVPIGLEEVAIMVVYTAPVENLDTPVFVSYTHSLHDSGSDTESILNTTEL